MPIQQNIPSRLKETVAHAFDMSKSVFLISMIN